MKCEKSLTGKHLLRKELLRYDEISNGERVVTRAPLYADRCIYCGRWGKIYEPNSLK